MVVAASGATLLRLADSTPRIASLRGEEETTRVVKDMPGSQTGEVALAPRS